MKERAAILLVDDRPENLLALEALLSELGPDVVIRKACSGDEALKWLLKEDFAVLLMDVQMPGLSGFETARLIKRREKSRHIPIIFVTALNKDARFVDEGYQVGAVDYLFKPLDADILRSKVAVFLDLYRKNRELQRLQAAQIAHLREVDELKDEFLSVVSHELRTPLNFITGFASILDDEVAGPLTGQQHDFLRKILSGSDRMLVLVNDLLDFAKLQAGHFDLHVRPAPFAPLVEEVVATLQPLAAQKQMRLDTALAAESWVDIDEKRVIQLLTNLVGNAIKFTPAGGWVRVRTRIEGTQLVCEVEDTGIGIAPEDLSTLFVRFRQLDMGRTREAGGTGLGLSITKALVEAHGGRVEAESPGRGHGSIFRFTLPLSAGPSLQGPSLAEQGGGIAEAPSPLARDGSAGTSQKGC